MPCNSDHMEPTVQERQRQEAAKHLVYVAGTMGMTVADRVRNAANDIYCSDDCYMRMLCETLRGLNPEDFERVVYNPHSAAARALADWWEEHEREDEKAAAAQTALEKKFYAEVLVATQIALGSILLADDGEEHKICINAYNQKAQTVKAKYIGTFPKGRMEEILALLRLKMVRSMNRMST